MVPVSADLEARLLDLALRRGLLSPAQVHGNLALDADAGSSVWGPRIQALLDEGTLSVASVQSLLAELVQEGTLAPQLDESLPPAVVPLETAAPPIHALGRYSGLRFVGMGGTGRVYRAHDGLLDRPVALKFLRWDRAAVRAAQLVQEARSQARVKHPRIREVYEVGELDGQVFIAMQWVEGGTLAEAAPELGLEAKVRLMAEVCDGVAAAQAQGLLHLDIKPGNILVERGAEGGWAPFVSDFGLAPAVEGGSRGVGTPPYASPEQLFRGSAGVDVRSDVYGLGVTFFQLLTGRLPGDADFGAAPGAEVPAELLAVARKAMSTLPGERYADAGALGEELRRYLEHRPLSVRRRAPAYLLRLWTRRHRAQALALAAAAVLALGTAASALRARMEAARQAQAAERFGQELREVVDLTSLMNLMPPQDRSRRLGDIQARMAALEAELAHASPGLRGAGLEALGEAHLLLEDWEPARASLQGAWDAGLRTPELARALGQVQAMLYFSRLYEIETSSSAAEHQEALDRELRRPALELLRRAPAAAGSPVEIIREELEGREAEALALASEDLQQPMGWRYESWAVLFDLWDSRSGVLIYRGRYEEAARLLDVWGRALDRCLEVGRSDPKLYRVMGLHRLARAFLLQAQGQDPLGPLEEADRAFAQAAFIEPSDLSLDRWRGDVLRRVSAYQRERGEDPTASLARAEALLRPVARSEGAEAAKARWCLARVLTDEGDWALLHDQPAQRYLEEAEANLRDLPPWRPQLISTELSIRVRLDADLMLDALRRGADPYPALERWLHAVRSGLGHFNASDTGDHVRRAQELEQALRRSAAPGEARTAGLAQLDALVTELRQAPQD